ncbi:Flp pilus assembly complex ATPase component TadA [Geomonas sp. RF6]|uniref:GspE/PulE family protein n=1 Tax=Geomonas sp. RF6 TaxID=2897342 RepID=UPI001E44FAAE|nr:GspE/PulE family protein [Geomonas sp. RF6]UFS72220.1 Flp pilus assembly complex ATPase component TadA [Geomonas sp. RF6]
MPAEEYKARLSKIGEFLIANGDIKPEQLADALEQQKGTGKRLGKLLVELGYTTEGQIVAALHHTLGIDCVDLKNCVVHREALLLVPKDLAEKKHLVPLRVEGRRLLVAMVDPLDYMTIQEISFRSGLTVAPLVAAESVIHDLMEKYYGSSARIVELLTTLPADEVEAIKEVRLDAVQQGRDEIIDAAPIVRVVSFIINEAVRRGASDVHVEPHEFDVNVRLRIDGELSSLMRFPKAAQVAVTSRIKILASLDIANRKVPQDGRCAVKILNRPIDLRVSTMPTVFGEKVVMRLLDHATGKIPLAKLGLDDEMFRPFFQMTKWSRGMILVAGPTGSGKTTTLHAVLQQLQTDKKNIVTIEDPVEFRLEGVTQIGIHERAGLTFSSTLRSVLRQDPDIIMVGEIRDHDTAEIAARAALTGHMVFSTIHTNDTVATIARLYDMGLKPYLINAALSGVMAQRLVKRICPHCRVRLQREELATYGIPFLTVAYKGSGCRECQMTGYKGRVGIYEFLPITKEIRHLISAGADEDELWVAARAAGTVALIDAAWKKVELGETTIEEVAINMLGGTMSASEAPRMAQEELSRDSEIVTLPAKDEFFGAEFDGAFQDTQNQFVGK